MTYVGTSILKTLSNLFHQIGVLCWEKIVYTMFVEGINDFHIKLVFA